MKLKSLLTLSLGLLLFKAEAQKASPDEIKTAKGAITIQPIEHATFSLKADNKTIYVDPTGGAEAFQGLAKPDLILITDIHPDHLDGKTLEALSTSQTTLVVPQAVAEKLPVDLKGKKVILKNGQKTQQLGLNIAAVPMYNTTPERKNFHSKGRGNGYIITVDGKNIYISGDTEDIPEMKALKNIDVAFVCMNLPYTMTVAQAERAVLAFKPKIVYPYHYRGQNGLSDVNEFKNEINKSNKQIEVRLRNWYPNSKG